MLGSFAQGVSRVLEETGRAVGVDAHYVGHPALEVTPLDRQKQLGVVAEMTEIIAVEARDPSLAERTWVLITEAPDGGWGIDGHAYTSVELGEAARRELAGS